MGEPAKKIPNPEDWGDVEIERNTRLIEAIDSGRTKYSGDPAVLETVRMGLQWRADQQAGDADALELPFSTWRAANMPALPADAPLQPGEDPAEAPMAKPDAPAAAAPAPAATPAEPPSMWSHLAAAGDIAGNKMREFFEPAMRPPGIAPGEEEAARETFRDSMRGAGQGFTFGFGDEMAASVGSVLPAPFEGERATGRGFDAPLMTREQERDARFNADLASEREANAEAQERSPWAYGAGQVAGTMPAAIAAAPLFGAAGGGAGAAGAAGATAQAAQVPWRVLAARNAAQGAVMGAAAGAGGSEEGSRMSDAAIGAAGGAAGGVVGTGVAAGVSAGLGAAKRGVTKAANAVKDTAPVRAIRDFAAEQAPRFRLASVGPYGSQIKKIAEREGFDYTERDLGNAIEEAYPAEEGFLGLPKLRSPRDFAKQARPRMEQAGRDIGESLEAMDEQGVSAPLFRDPQNPGDERAVLDVLDEEIAKYDNPLRIGKKDQALKSALADVRDNTLRAGDPATGRSLGDGMPRLRATELATVKRSLEDSFPDHVAKSVSDAASEQAEMIGSAGPRQALYEAAERNADPETFGRWNRANKDYALHKTVAELAEGRTAQEQGNQIASLPSAVGTVASGGIGLPVAAAWEGAKRYGADAVAHGMYGTARGLAPKAAQPVSPLVEQAIRATARPGVSWGALAQRGQPASAEQQREPRVQIGEAEITSRGNAETSRGHEVQQDVRNALKAYPQVLGPFKEQLRAVEGDPMALSAAISDLSANPRWQQEVLPKLMETRR